MAGSCASRSASFTSSYPAKRPNTDWRNCPTRVWRPFAPVRVSVRTSPAVSLRQRASSSSRQASRPPSDRTFVPWNSSLRRRSNVRPSTAVCGSPNVASIRGTRYRPYPADNLSRTDAYCQCQTKISGKTYTSPCSCLVDAGRPRVAQRPELAARDRVRQGEGVAAEHVDVPEAQGREPGDVFGPDLVSLGAELVDRRIHVDRVPEHDEVDHEPKRAELVLLALAVALAELAPLAMEDDAGELVTALAAVELHQDAPAVALVVDEAQQVERLHQAAQFLECAGEPRRAVVRLQRAGEAGGAHDPELQGARGAGGGGPGLGDEPHVDPVGRQLVEQAVICLRVDAPEPRAAHVGDPGRELVAEEMENAEDRVGVAGRVRHDLGGLEFCFLLEDNGEQVEAVAQRAGDGDCVQAGVLVGSKIIPGDTAHAAKVARVRPRVNRPDRHDKAQAIGGRDLSAAPASGEWHGVLGRDQRGVGGRQRLGAQEVLLDPTHPRASERGQVEPWQARVDGRT